MAIRKVTLANGEVRYRVRRRDPSGRSLQRTFLRLEEARQWDLALALAKSRGDWLDPRGAKIKFEQHSEDWLKRKIVSAGTLENIQGRLRNHILPIFGKMGLGTIRPSDVEAWKALLKQKSLAPATINASLITLSEIMKAAVADDLIRRSPCDSVKPLPNKSREEMRFLTHDQVAVLAESIDPRYSTLTYTAAWTGMRWG